MRVSCDPILFFKEMTLEKTMSLEDWFQIAVELGLDGTEIQHNCLRGYEPDYLEHMAWAVKETGLEVSQFISAPDFTNPDPEYRAQEVQKLRRHVDIAAFFGACCVRVTAGQEYPNVPLEQGCAWVVKCFQECLEYADQKGVWLAYENHYKDYFWERPDFSMRHEIYLEILDRLRDTSLKVNFDCANPIMTGENPVDLLGKVMGRVVHVHCTDRATPFEYTHAVAGEGLVDYPTVFKILKQAGYDSWLSVEYNGPEGIEGLKRAIAYVRKTWEEVADA
jgi:sugar phosphate isomerase/epimerase